jgi:hypothetical protein
MSPKERAKELVDKFKKNTRAYNETNGWEDSAYDAKQCALIAVHEILQITARDNYWKNVKQEIEKI